MGGRDKDPKTYIDTTNCAKFPSTDPLNFNLTGYIFLCNSYVNLRLLQKYINGSQYGVI